MSEVPMTGDRETAERILERWSSAADANGRGIFDFKGGPIGDAFLTTAIAAALAAEREACAKVADGYLGADVIAAAIRARGGHD